MRVSNRSRATQASPIRKLIPFADAAKSRGVRVLHLNIGQPDIPTPPEAMSSVRNFEDKVLAYSPSNGYLSLRESYADYLGHYEIALGPEHINVTTGGSEALVFALAATCDPGDNVVIPEPFYANYKSFAAMLGIEIRPVTTSINQSFHLEDPGMIRTAIDDRTRAILLCSPGNPTGTVYTAEEIAMVGEIALERDLFIISDEVYREFVFVERGHVSPMHIPDLEDRVIMTDSVSKRYSSCGARIGFLASKNEEVMQAVLKYAMARLSPPSIEQVLAEREFRLDFSYFNEVVEEYRGRRDALASGLSDTPGVTLSRPEGAFYAIARLPVDDSEVFCRWLLSDFEVDGETVMVAPAAGFYATEGLGKNEVRIAYVLNSERIKRAVYILNEGLNAYAAVDKNPSAAQTSS